MKYHQISAILTDLQEDFPERLSRTANFAEHFVSRSRDICEIRRIQRESGGQTGGTC
jgi:hypothetical protein